MYQQYHNMLIHQFHWIIYIINNDNGCPIPPAAPNTATLACTGDVLDVNDRLHLLNRLHSLGGSTSA